MEIKNKIKRRIMNLSGRYSPREIFKDWVTIMALTIANISPHDAAWEKREQEYLAISSKYTKAEMTEFCGMMALLMDAFAETGPADILGEVFMEMEMGDSGKGQFWTPFNVALMMAKMLTGAQVGPLTVMEPTCGSGVMIIAQARALMDRGLNYQKLMDVTAIDIDWTAVRICYVQLSFLGIKATCICDNALFPREDLDPLNVMVTPIKRLDGVAV